MYTLQEVANLRDLAVKGEGSGYCNVLSDLIYEELFGQDKNDDDQDLLFLAEEYNDLDNEFDGNYADYVVQMIGKELVDRGIIFLEMADSVGGFEANLRHEFVLFNTNDGIIRVESYGKHTTSIYDPSTKLYKIVPGEGSLYCGKITIWENYEDDIRELIDAHHGEERLSIWNKIFSVHEENDTDDVLDVTIFKPHQ